MKFRPSDRMLQLGVVPALTSHVREAFPVASASLWQRDAKAAHRRIVASASEVPGESPFARQGRTVVSLAALLLGFHEAAPAGTEVSEDAFASMVDVALGTPIVHMLLSGADPLSDTGVRELSGLLEAGTTSADAYLWAGVLRLEGAALSGEANASGIAAGGQALVCEVARCGLMRLCVSEQRLYLLKYLCKIEAVQAAAAGVRLERSSCIARGERTCRMRCTRA